MTTDNDPLEGYVSLELVGHQELVGFIREVTIAGMGFFRIDIALTGDANITRYYPVSMVRCITLVNKNSIKDRLYNSNQLKDMEIADFLAVQRTEIGEYRFGASQIASFVGGRRVAVLARIREIRADSDVDAGNVF